MKTIPAYGLYIQHGDLIELHWVPKRQQAKAESALVLQINQLEPQFQAAGYKPLYLLNATAQLALSHHLDDELSKQVSVAANTAMTRQITRKSTGAILPEEHADRAYAALCNIGRQMGTPLYIVQQEAVKMIAHTTGVDLAPFLLAAPAQDAILDEEVMLEPTDLAKEFHIASGREMNLLLQSWGWQIRNIAHGWEPTPAGKLYCSRHAWSRGDKSGFNLKWKRTAIEGMLKQQADGESS